MEILKKAISICSIVLALSACTSKQVGGGPSIDLNNDGIPDNVYYENITSDLALGGEHYDDNNSKLYLSISRKTADGHKMEKIALGSFGWHVRKVFYQDMNSDKLLDIIVVFDDGTKYAYFNNGNGHFSR